MSHIHELIDFTVNALIVYENKILLVDHKKIGKWMPIGGHIELDEDPEEALLRETQEECGLTVEVVGNKPEIQDEIVKPLIPPVYMDIHRINDTHQHIGLVYFARAKSNNAILAEAEHNAIRWFTREELDDPQFTLYPAIAYYAKQALSQLTT